MLPEYFEFTLPTKVLYGVGILGNIKASLAMFGPRRALLVTDEILVNAGPVDKVKAGFKDSNIDIAAIFDKVPPNSTIKTVQDCAALAKKKKCDLIIAIGGGSVIDTAKVANLLLVKGGKLEDHMGAYLLAKDEALLPAIFIPTTAGTGSEVTKVAVIADPDQDVKLPFTEDQFLPQLAILDPAVTASMPGRLTAYTGMDALTHAIEAYVDKEWSPASDALALHAIRLISDNILQACAHPEDLQARGAMLVGSFLAGVAFSHSMVGMAHGIAHALGGVYHLPHGLANAIVLPEVMQYNLEAQLERFADIAMAMGISFPQLVSESQSLLKSDHMDLISKVVNRADFDALKHWVQDQSLKARGLAARALGSLGFVDHWFRRQAAEAAVAKVRTLNRQLAHLTQMPLDLAGAGVKDNLAKLDQVVTTALEDGAMLYNPVEPSREDIAAILKTVLITKSRPLAVSPEDLQPSAQRRPDRQMQDVFENTQMVYDVLAGFYEQLKAHPTIGPSLQKTNLCVQFVYQNPSATITIDASHDGLGIHRGAYDGRQPEVTMTMNADFAHKFWHGKANLLTALTRRQVVAKGNVPKTIKLLPILKPAFELYPQYLRDKGLDHLVMP